MSYQDTTGCLNANSHPGSYTGQDAYADMLVTENRNVVRRKWTASFGTAEQSGKTFGLYARSANFSGGGDEEMTENNEELYVRRLTPLECERLQGFPDNWTLVGIPVETKEYRDEETGETWTETIYEYTDSTGKKRKTSDSARYKALGNSIALPFWQWLARRICALYPRQITVGSLFDGIGGFPLVFSRCGAKPVWASEIEEFPIAVTKEHFPEEPDTDTAPPQECYSIDYKMGQTYVHKDMGNSLASRDYKMPQAAVYRKTVSSNERK